ATEGGAWAAGWFLSAADTALWVTRLDWDGQVQWRQRYGLSGQDLQAVAMAVEGEMLGLLLRQGTEETIWLRLEADGTQVGADQISWPGAEATLGHGLSVQDEDWYVMGQLRLSGGDRQLFLLEWESDDGYEGATTWDLGQTDGPSVGGPGRAYHQWLLSAGAGSQGPGLRLLHAESDGDLLLNRSYAWPGEAVMPVWVGTSRPGLVAWLLRRPGGGSYWGQTDEQGNSFCYTDTVRSTAVAHTQPDVVSLSLNNLGITGSQAAATLNPLGSLGSPVVLCDNSGCDVRAYFTLPSLETCQGGDLIPLNLSEQATAYTWWLDGEAVNSQASPLLEAPGDPGDYELVLVASAGPCVDSFRVPLRVRPDLQLAQLDSVHCGPRLTLTAPEAVGYTWRNDDDSLLSTAASFTFEESGNYTLKLEDACGETIEAGYNISLQGDCVWPGDVSADGQVDMVDYLLLGLVHGQSGPARANASPDYVPQTAAPWAGSFGVENPWAPGINLAHADANGDGLVDAASDGALVRAHYQAGRLPQLSPDPQAEVEVGLQLDTTVVRSGDTVGFQVTLFTTDGQPIPDAYGLALTLESSIPLSQPMEVSPQGSWLTTGGSQDTLVLREPGNRRLRVGLNRLDQVAAPPSQGLVMSGIIIVVIDDIGSYGALAERGFLSLAVTEALLIQPDGNRIALNPLGTQSTRTVEVLRHEGPALSVLPDADLLWEVFPNPTEGRVRVRTGRLPGRPGAWCLRSLQGKTLAEGVWPAHQAGLEVELGHLPAGYYLLEVRQHGQVHHAKVWLQR
ncbi:MAG: T9SS C-terminal target domain-containing protein, partial [Bacteroidetes bacterium]